MRSIKISTTAKIVLIDETVLHIVRRWFRPASKKQYVEGMGTILMMPYAKLVTVENVGTCLRQPLQKIEQMDQLERYVELSQFTDTKSWWDTIIAENTNTRDMWVQRLTIIRLNGEPAVTPFKLQQICDGAMISNEELLDRSK